MASGDLSRINTNIGALNALNALNKINSEMSLHQLRLATGKKINSAADDAAGFTIASKLKVKAEGLGTALDNIGSAKNLMTVAEGHLTNIQEILSKMKLKAEQAATDSLGTDERAAVEAELTEYNNQINSEVSQAKWANVDILSTDKTFQIGVGTSTSDSLTFNVANSVTALAGTTFDASGLGVVLGSTGTASIGTVAVAKDGVITATSSDIAVATAADTMNGYLDALGEGHYTLEVKSTVGAASTVSYEIKLLDSNGDTVRIDANGATSDNGTADSLTINATSVLNLGKLYLGVGLSIDLGVVTTTGDGLATYGFDYEYAGGSNNVTTQSAAQDFMDKIDTAFDNVSKGLSYIGTQYNRLSFQEQSMTVSKINTESAYSQIVNADMAWEQLQSTKLQILQQTATAMLAQANVAPQSLLSLFK